MKKALIIGSNGQDGRLLKSFLEARADYHILGLDRGEGIDITNYPSILETISSHHFDEIYHLAAFHHSSQEQVVEDPEFYKKTFDINFYSLLNVLESVRLTSKNTRVFYAASSHIFKPSLESSALLNEQSALEPLTAYAQSKVLGKFLCERYRREFGIFASCGILFNHESEFRSEHFLSKKIVRGLLKHKFEKGPAVEIADFTAVFDMGWAEDFVRAMWLILQHRSADDYVVATSTPHTTLDFAEVTCKILGLNLNIAVTQSARKLERAAKMRIGDTTKIRNVLNWKPETSFEEMISKLIDKEMKSLGYANA